MRRLLATGRLVNWLPKTAPPPPPPPPPLLLSVTIASIITTGELKGPVVHIERARETVAGQLFPGVRPGGVAGAGGWFQSNLAPPPSKAPKEAELERRGGLTCPVEDVPRFRREGADEVARAAGEHINVREEVGAAAHRSGAEQAGG